MSKIKDPIVFWNTAKRYEQPEMIEEGIKEYKTKDRKILASRLSDRDFLEKVSSYFKNNRVLGGEAALRDLTEYYQNEYKEAKGLLEHTPTKDGLRESMNEEYAKICVKQAKVENQSVKDVVRSGALRYEHDNMYSMRVHINSDGSLLPYITDIPYKHSVGQLDESFKQNHPAALGLDATFIIVDNQKMIKKGETDLRSATCRVIIDLGQDNDGGAPILGGGTPPMRERERLYERHAADENDDDKKEDDDFARALNALGNDVKKAEANDEEDDDGIEIPFGNEIDFESVPGLGR